MARRVYDVQGRDICLRPDGFVGFERKPVKVKAKKMNQDFFVANEHGIMKGKAGDWLVQGADGAVYPVAAKDFGKLYEKVE